jgi:sec-independent protein translocase protein TatB
MFDIGFSEMMVIAIIALVVIGPEKLPRMARTIGLLAGRLQRYVADVKADINREMELDELRKMRDSMQQAASSFESSVQGEINKANAEVAKVEGELNAAAASLDSPAGAPASQEPAKAAEIAPPAETAEAAETAKPAEPAKPGTA